MENFNVIDKNGVVIELTKSSLNYLNLFPTIMMLML